MFRKVISLMAAVSFSPLLLDSNTTPDSKRHAICILYPSQSVVNGVVSFSQDDITAPTKIACVVRGLNPNAKHGMHIHEFGDLT
jgi:Cu/Zn superoxide dismutase